MSPNASEAILLINVNISIKTLIQKAIHQNKVCFILEIQFILYFFDINIFKATQFQNIQ